jgi:hypothetical protein
MIKLIIAVLSFTVAITSQAQDLAFGENAFEGVFQIDSTFTRDAGQTYEVSASGEAGDYGRVYLSYEFTDKLGMQSQGEFTGFAWTQNGEEVNTATLRGIYKKQGSVFKLYSFDNISDGKLNVATGVVDFVAKTMKFSVSEIASD